MLAPIMDRGPGRKPTRASRSRKVAETSRGASRGKRTTPTRSWKQWPGGDRRGARRRARRAAEEEEDASRLRGGRNQEETRRRRCRCRGCERRGRRAAATPKIHLPTADLGAEPPARSDEAQAEAPKKKRTRRGSRGGKRRRKPAAPAVSAETETSP